MKAWRIIRLRSGVLALTALLLRSTVLSQVLEIPIRSVGDTTEVIRLLEKAQEHWALYQWDSVEQCASKALVLTEQLLADVPATDEVKAKRELVRLKALSLGQLGRISTVGKVAWQLDSALELARSIGDRSGEARVLMYRSEVQYEQGRYSEAIRSANEAVEIHRGLGDEVTAAAYLNMSGEYYRVMGDPSAALEIHLEALPITKASGDLSALAWNCILIGAVHRSTEDWDRALEYFYRARRYYEQAGDRIGIAIAYNDLGTAYFGRGDMDSSMHWHSRAAEIRQEIGSFDGLGHSLRYIARIHERNVDLDEAISMYRSAISSYARVPFLTAMATTHGHIASALIELDDLQAALNELTEALALLSDRKERAEVPALYYRLAEVHDRQGDQRKAVFAYRNGLQVAGSLNDHAAVATGWNGLYRTYVSMGRYKDAFEAHQLYMVASDSMQLRADRSSVIRSMMRHDLEQERIKERANAEAERSIRRLELEKQRGQKYVYITGGSLLGMLALGLVGRLRYTSRAQERMAEQRVRTEEARARAEQSERFKERFLANMSHEIRTPMNAIVGMTSILRRNKHLTTQEHLLDGIARNSSELLGTLNAILDLSKLDAGRLALESVPMDPKRIADGMRKRMMEATEGEVVFEYDVPSPAALVGDPMRMEQVVLELVTIARTLPGPATVRVELEILEVDAGNADVLWKVTHEGHGTPDEDQERILQAYSDDPEEDGRNYEGMELRATLSKRLVKEMGGSLSVMREAEGRTAFRVRIPCELVEPDRRVTVSGNVPDELRGVRILLADDNAFNVMVARDELLDAIEDVRVDVAVNGLEAVELAAANSYDAVLMDVQMPELNGYDATRRIRELGGRSASIPILAMTANVMQGEWERCRAAGMDDIVPKPFDRNELIDKLVSLMGIAQR